MPSPSPSPSPSPLLFLDSRFRPIAETTARALLTGASFSARTAWFMARIGKVETEAAHPSRGPYATTAYLTCDGAFLSLIDARAAVKGYGGDARRVFVLCADGRILRTRHR